MVELRSRASESWLDPEGGKLVAWKYGRRLLEVCKGRKGLFLTLTYRREEYSSSLDLYRRQSERKHIKCFMQKMERRLKRSLTGLWVRKMEFQEGGWVHWHIILLDVGRIAHKTLKEAWGHGHVWVKKLTKECVRYTCKYVAKGGVGLPAFLRLEPVRSVRIMQASPGFWGEDRKPSNYCPIYAKYGPPKPQRIAGCCTPLAVSLRQGRSVVVRQPRERRCFSVKCDLAELSWRLQAAGVACCGVERGWARFGCGSEEVERAAASCQSGPSGGGTPPRSGGLHLRGTGERHGWDPEWGAPEWLAEIYRDEAWEEYRQQEAWPSDARLAS